MNIPLKAKKSLLTIFTMWIPYERKEVQKLSTIFRINPYCKELLCFQKDPLLKTKKLLLTIFPKMIPLTIEKSLET